VDDDLKRRQAAAASLEQRMKDFLLNFEPADKLSVGDAKTIARFASSFAFDEFSPKQQD